MKVSAAPRAQVVEPLVYAPQSRDSFFRDIVLSQLQRDPEATARLARHRAQMVVERAERDRVAATEFGIALHALEGRANPSSTVGAGGEFDVPAYLVDKFASGTQLGTSTIRRAELFQTDNRRYQLQGGGRLQAGLGAMDKNGCAI